MSREFESVDISRRNLLKNAGVAVGGAAVFAVSVTANTAKADKMSQKGADYQATPKNGQQCDGCNLFVSPSSCRIVDGAISPTGWCRFFSKKS